MGLKYDILKLCAINILVSWVYSNTVWLTFCSQFIADKKKPINLIQYIYLNLSEPEFSSGSLTYFWNLSPNIAQPGPEFGSLRPQPLKCCDVSMTHHAWYVLWTFKMGMSLSSSLTTCVQSPDITERTKTPTSSLLTSACTLWHSPASISEYV